jgi:hypothetical protein
MIVIYADALAILRSDFEFERTVAEHTNDGAVILNEGSYAALRLDAFPIYQRSFEAFAGVVNRYGLVKISGTYKACLRSWEYIETARYARAPAYYKKVASIT